MFRIFSTIHQIELGKFPGDHLLLEVVFQEPWDLYGATKKKHGKWKDLKQWRIQEGARGARRLTLIPNWGPKGGKIFFETALTTPPLRQRVTVHCYPRMLTDDLPRGLMNLQLHNGLETKIW